MKVLRSVVAKFGWSITLGSVGLSTLQLKATKAWIELFKSFVHEGFILFYTIFLFLLIEAKFRAYQVIENFFFCLIVGSQTIKRILLNI